MYQKENSSWVKHADFTICDMLCLQLAFVLAYWIETGSISHTRQNCIEMWQW